MEVFYNMKQERNGYMLNGRSAGNGYDWWWHSLIAKNDNTGELEPFFIEYFIMNPALGSADPVFGQIPGKPNKPAYAMIKAGKWGDNKTQLNNFYGTDHFQADRNKMNVKIGDHIATETKLKGSVSVTSDEASNHPEYMSDSGSLSWDLEVEKVLSFSVGYGASKLFRSLNLFQMFWHVQGMKTLFSGKILFNGQSYTVEKKISHGYQDKNWGSDYTNPWVWLNCNNFTDESGHKVTDSSLDVGGGNPKVLGLALGAKLLAAFSYEGKLYEFNFSKIFFQKQKWKCREDDDSLYWDISLSNKNNKIEIHFSCPKKGMLLINYENPRGEKNHTNLWNGGYASGTVRLIDKKSGDQICELNGSLGGCEYGKY